MNSSVRVIGVGNSFAGDDAAGILVARKLKAINLLGVDIIETDLVGFDLLDYLEGSDCVIVIDAVHSGKETGRIIRLDIPQDLQHVSNLVWDSTISSTHAFSLGEALTLGEVLEVLPPKLTVYGIELDKIDQGGCVSENVSAAIEQLANQIEEELKGWSCTNSN